jgi:hypothetical protein
MMVLGIIYKFYIYPYMHLYIVFFLFLPYSSYKSHLLTYCTC